MGNGVLVACHMPSSFCITIIMHVPSSLPPSFPCPPLIALAIIPRLNHARYKEWEKQDVYTAATLFDGPAYRELKAADMDAEDVKFAKDHV